MENKARLRRFLGLIRPEWTLILLATSAGIARFLIPLAVPWGIKLIIDEVLLESSATGSWFRLHTIALSLIGLYILWAVFSFLRLYASGLAGNRIIFRLRHQLFQHLQNMSLAFFDQRKVGAIVSRVTSDIKAAENLVGYGVTATLMDLASLFVICWIICFLQWQLALLTFVLFPLHIVFSRIFSKRIRQHAYKVQSSIESLSGMLHEVFSGVFTLRSFTREKETEQAFLAEAKTHRDAMDLNFRDQAIGLTLTGFLSAVAPLCIIWVGGAFVLQGSLSVGSLVAFYGYVGLLYSPVSRLSELNVVIGTSLAALDRIYEVLDQPCDVQDSEDSLEAKNIEGNIEFDQVSFGYSDKQNLLEECSFKINAGEKVLITGKNGSGKSTLIRLLLRFYPVKKGIIRLDGKPIENYQLESFRKQFSVVAQNPILFSGSVLENVLLGNSEATEVDAISAAKKVGIHELIEGLPQGYSTVVGEKGLKLSGGERQRIAMARAYLKNAPIVILDEATSSVDAGSASLIKSKVHDLWPGKTVITIAHHTFEREDVDVMIELSSKKTNLYKTQKTIR